MEDSVIRVKRKKKNSGIKELGAALGFSDQKETISSAAKKKIELDDIDRQRKQDSEELRRANKLTLSNIIAQCGLDITLGQFYIYSILAAAAAFVAVSIGGFSLWVSLPIASFAGLALPRWYVLRARSKRFKKFTGELPGALESIVRNLKSGIPALEAIKILASEGKEPIRSEFQILMKEQAMGLTLSHAFERMAIRVPMEESRFLAIAIEIQAKSGGNLSEILTNLATVLRERRRLKMKIHSMTAESRIGAMIVGGIPFAILLALSFLQPDHTAFFFENNLGIFVLVGCIIWQCIGVFVMWKMTNFKI